MAVSLGAGLVSYGFSVYITGLKALQCQMLAGGGICCFFFSGHLESIRSHKNLIYFPGDENGCG